jgi:hypothetical protein
MSEYTVDLFKSGSKYVTEVQKVTSGKFGFEDKFTPVSGTRQEFDNYEDAYVAYKLLVQEWLK